MDQQPSMEQAFLKRLTDIVEENFDKEDFGVQELAHEAGLSRSQMHRKLKKLTGQSGSQFIREIRLQHALEMLQKEVATVSEIAYRVGFSSPTYFSTCFHEYYGYPPGEAAERNSKETQYESPKEKAKVSSKSRSKDKLPLYIIVAFVIILLLGGYYYFNQSGGTDTEERQSIAVLPLDNLTGDPEQAFFVEGLHDALIGELGQLKNLRVISRTSTLPFNRPETNLSRIAQRLKVNNIIEGSVYSVGDSIRIQLQLIGMHPEEHHLWAQSYNSDMSDVLNILNEVSREIASNIQLKLTPGEQKRLNKSVSLNRETYEAYLRGMFYIQKATREDVRKGLDYLHEAIEKNPADPMAYAGLAQGFINQGHGPTPSQDAFLKAKAAAQTAIKLDSSIAKAYSVLGSYKIYHEHDWDGAEWAFERANMLNPNLPWNHYHYAWYLYLAGREKEAISEHKLAHELDPLNPYINGWLAWLYAEYGYYKLAEQEVNKTLELEENHPLGLFALAKSYMGQGKYAEAVPILKKAAHINPSRRGALGHSLILAGRPDEARKILQELIKEESNSFNAVQIAGIYASLGENDKAFQWLSFEPPHAITPWAGRIDRFDSLRTDPRYNEFLDRFNLLSINNFSPVPSPE